MNLPDLDGIRRRFIPDQIVDPAHHRSGVRPLRAMARRTSLTSGLAVVTAFSVAMPATAWISIRAERQATRDEVRPADVIVVFGCGGVSPAAVACAEGAVGSCAGPLPQAPGAPHHDHGRGGAGGDPVFAEGDIGRDYLTSRGVPPDAIVVGGCEYGCLDGAGGRGTVCGSGGTM
jgi:hypothetical protein